MPLAGDYTNASDAYQNITSLILSFATDPQGNCYPPPWPWSLFIMKPFADLEEVEINEKKSSGQNKRRLATPVKDSITLSDETIGRKETPLYLLPMDSFFTKALYNSKISQLLLSLLQVKINKCISLVSTHLSLMNFCIVSRNNIRRHEHFCKILLPFCRMASRKQSNFSPLLQQVRRHWPFCIDVLTFMVRR